MRYGQHALLFNLLIMSTFGSPVSKCSESRTFTQPAISLFHKAMKVMSLPTVQNGLFFAPQPSVSMAYEIYLSFLERI
ncbi:hypothetical protein EDB84DRAFT_1536641 [Lactarius hengduanensis]|nr:hypothetical protein EDB84DRAFT_1536641 [Lactarius hengduanensis]